VDSRPLPAQASAGIAGGGRGMASFAPASAASTSTPEVTGTVAQRPAPAGHWSWNGGTPITVTAGDTVETIAHRYGVPASAIMQANGITAPASLHAGQQLVIPRYVQAPAAIAASPPPTRPATAAATSAAAAGGNPGVHVVARGETLSKISRLYRKPIHEIERANNLAPGAKLNVGDRLVIPGVRTSAAAPRVAPAVAQGKAAPAAQPSQPEPEQTASMFAPVAQPPSAAADLARPPEPAGALPKFRWPANGRVIAPYGASVDGQQNDGINIALPENTPVKAAEDGTVAYAGNELKGYGNLVLVRHPNGYVTAYAHAKELMVKRGDQVKRGQVIAHSGQTGNVKSPQLHFEIRKGSTPQDPTKFLNGA
jgi:murein DD-endopeptidase MepM/ murein hydrolase activator NlpD